MTNVRSFAAPLLAVVCAAVFIAQLNWRPTEFGLLIEARADARVRLQLRYSDNSYPGEETVTRTVERGQRFVSVRFPIKSQKPRNLRLSQLGTPQAVDLRSLRVARLGTSPRKLTTANISAANADTQIVDMPGGGLSFSSKTSASAAVNISTGGDLKSSRLGRIWRWALVILLAAASVALLLVASRWPSIRNTGEINDKAQTKLRTGVIATLIACYVLASVFELNGSSSGLWRQYADGLPVEDGLLAGTPKAVRSDEWMLQTPWIFSQAAQTPSFSTTNPAIGSGVTPLVLNLPVRHWSTAFRPQMWPFFLISTERAFAFYWNFKVFGLLVAAILFFGVISGGKTVLDVCGALFLTFSPYVQWWFSTATCMPEMLAMFFLAMWLVTVILRTKSRRVAILAAVGLLFATLNFVFCCYPRFQVPLAYLAASLLLGGFVTSRLPVDFRRYRICLFAIVAAVAGAAIWLWWHDVAAVVRATSLLSYPGQVRSTGGGFSWSRLLAPFLEFSMTEQRFPHEFANVCEAAGFVFIAPMLAAAVIRDLFYGYKDRLSLVQVAVVATTIYFMLVGIPAWLAHISGWEYVYSTRAILLLGIATAILLVRCLGAPASRAHSAPSWLRSVGYFAAASAVLLTVLIPTNIQLARFETMQSVVAVALLFGVFSVCVWQQYALCACAVILVPQLYSCALINPVSQGLPGLTKSELLRWLATAHNRQPDGKWIVLGDSGRAQVLSEFVKATGAHALDGIHCNPDYEMLATLDPTRKYIETYNRYALVRFRPADVPAPVFHGEAGLSYRIEMQMRPDLLDRLGVRHILQVDIPSASFEIPGFHLSGDRNGIRLLERD